MKQKTTSVHFRHWNEKERLALTKAKSFGELAELALQIIDRMPEDINIVSGPISTGGVGSNAGNIKVFKNITEFLGDEMGLNVLSWIPFETRIGGMAREWSKLNPEGAYCMPILNDFYYPIFSSKKIKKVNFIHGWQSSFGASWEHKLCEELGIQREYLSAELSQKALDKEPERISTL
jgi:hypothetical protein